MNLPEGNVIDKSKFLTLRVCHEVQIFTKKTFQNPYLNEALISRELISN